MKRLLPPVLIVLTLYSCHRREIGYPLPEDDAQQTLFAPVPYQTGIEFIRISKYLGADHGVTRIESTSEWITPTLTPDSDLVQLTISKKRPYEANLLLWQDNVCYAIPLHRINHYDNQLCIPFDTLSNLTYLISDLNGWNPYTYPEFTPSYKGGYDVVINTPEGHYRAAFWQPDGLRFTTDSLPVVYNRQGTPSNVIYCGPVHFSVPVLYLSHQEGSSICCKVEKEVKHVVAYWNNHLLPNRFCSQWGSNIKVTIPAVADSTEGFLRIIAINDLGHSNDLLIPICNGQARLPKQPARYHCTDTLLYLGNNRTDLIAKLTATALTSHGHHRIAMCTLPSDTLSAEYAWQLTGPTSPQNVTGRTRLEQLHNRLAALQYGDFLEWDIQRYCWIYERRFMDESVIVLLNTSDEVVITTLTLPQDRLDITYYTLTGKKVDFAQSIEVAPHSYQILVSGES